MWNTLLLTKDALRSLPVVKKVRLEFIVQKRICEEWHLSISPWDAMNHDVRPARYQCGEVIPAGVRWPIREKQMCIYHWQYHHTLSGAKPPEGFSNGSISSLSFTTQNDHIHWRESAKRRLTSVTVLLLVMNTTPSRWSHEKLFPSSTAYLRFWNSEILARCMLTSKHSPVYRTNNTYLVLWRAELLLGEVSTRLCDQSR